MHPDSNQLAEITVRAGAKGPLSALVDSDRKELARRFSWFLVGGYARTKFFYHSRAFTLSLQHLVLIPLQTSDIVGLPKPELRTLTLEIPKIKFLDGNPLNCTRNNLDPQWGVGRFPLSSAHAPSPHEAPPAPPEPPILLEPVAPPATGDNLRSLLDRVQGKPGA